MDRHEWGPQQVWLTAWGWETFLQAGAHPTLEATTSHLSEGRHSWGGEAETLQLPWLPLSYLLFSHLHPKSGQPPAT